MVDDVTDARDRQLAHIQELLDGLNTSTELVGRRPADWRMVSVLQGIRMVLEHGCFHPMEQLKKERGIK